jgi:hypothetical protein
MYHYYVTFYYTIFFRFVKSYTIIYILIFCIPLIKQRNGPRSKNGGRFWLCYRCKLIMTTFGFEPYLNLFAFIAHRP